MSDSPQNPRKVLLAGCGSWGTKLAARIARGDTHLELVGVVDTNSTRAASIAHTHQTPWYLDLCRAVTTTKASAVIIATPPQFHASVARRAIALGIKHIRIEKPLAMSLEDAWIIESLASVNAARVQVGHTSIAAPEISVLRAIVPSVVSWESVRFSGCSARHNASSLWDLASHDAALFLYLGGDPNARPVFRHGFDGVGVAQSIINGSVVYDARARRITWNGGVIDAASEADPLGCELRRFADGEDNLRFGVDVVRLLARIEGSV